MQIKFDLIHIYIYIYSNSAVYKLFYFLCVSYLHLWNLWSKKKRSSLFPPGIWQAWPRQCKLSQAVCLPCLLSPGETGLTPETGAGAAQSRGTSRQARFFVQWANGQLNQLCLRRPDISSRYFSMTSFHFKNPQNRTNKPFICLTAFEVTASCPPPPPPPPAALIPWHNGNDRWENKLHGDHFTL